MASRSDVASNAVTALFSRDEGRQCRDEQWLGGLATLTQDATTLAVGETAPHAVSLALVKRKLQTDLANSALLTDLFRLIGVVFRDRVKDVGVKSLAGCSLSPSGVHQLLFLSSRDIQLVARYRAKGANRAPLQLHLALTQTEPSSTPEGVAKGSLLCYARQRL